MGICASFRGENNKHPGSKILLLGLDGAGKTTFLYRIILEDFVRADPTVGYNVETTGSVKGLKFTIWDIGGHDKIRPLWRYKFNNVQGLLYMVDSTDKSRLLESRSEMYEVLDTDTMAGVPVVIVANKQDCPGAFSCSTIAEQLSLESITNRQCCILGISAASGKGIGEVLNTLSDMVKTSQKHKTTTVTLK